MISGAGVRWDCEGAAPVDIITAHTLRSNVKYAPARGVPNLPLVEAHRALCCESNQRSKSCARASIDSRDSPL